VPDAVTFHRYEHHMCIKAADHEIGHLSQEFMIAVHIEVLSSATRLAHRHPHEPRTCRNAFRSNMTLAKSTAVNRSAGSAVTVISRSRPAFSSTNFDPWSHTVR
jgi:hypothetical protein